MMRVGRDGEQLPCLARVAPLAAALPSPVGTAGSAPLEIALFGCNLGPGCKVFCRGSGRSHVVASAPVTVAAGPPGAAPARRMLLNLCAGPAPHAPGCLEWEAQLGGLLSDAQPMLLLPDAAAVAGVRQLEADATGIPDVPACLRGVGAALRYTSSNAGASLEPPALCVATRLAQRSSAVAAGHGWPALLALLLPAVRAGSVAAHDAAAGMDAAVSSCVMLHALRAGWRFDC